MVPGRGGERTAWRGCGGVHERPFAVDGGEAAAAEAAHAAVVFVVAEDRFDGGRALFVGGGSFGGA